MKILKKMWILAIPAVIFATLSLFICFTGTGLAEWQVFPILSGLLAYSLLLFELLLAARPRFLEKQIGLPELYAVHGMTGFAILIVVIAHANAAMRFSERFSALAFVFPTGILSAILFLLAILTGAFILSGILAQRIKWITQIQKKWKRETGLFIHGFSVLSVFLVFVHMLSLELIRSNVLFCVLNTLYVLIQAGVFFSAKVKARHTHRYTLTKLKKLNKNVFDLELSFASGKPLNYRAGQYVFLTFVNSALPRESHPFSISSSPADNNRLLLTVKQSGDYTRKISELKAGDMAVLEGPYGHFYRYYDKNGDSPLILLAGGIGITPLLSILREQTRLPNSRKIILLWSLSKQSDVLLLDELEFIKRNYSDFTYIITLSKEKADKFRHGRISMDLLEESGIRSLKGKGEYFICGPLSMMNATKDLLVKSGVPSQSIHMEKFSF